MSDNNNSPNTSAQPDKQNSAPPISNPYGLQYHSLMLTLEPRIVFDAAGAAVIAQEVNSAVNNDANNDPNSIDHNSDGTVTESPANEHSIIPKEVATAPFSALQTDAVSRALPQINPSRNEIVIIDKGVEDYQKLANHLSRKATVLVISDEADGVKQITQFLANKQNIDAIHIISHGNIGEVQLGKEAVNQQNISNYANDLKSWGKSLRPQGDILLYGCSVGEGTEGKAFVHSIAQLTGASIAASDDMTGNLKHGGNWTLEVSEGKIDENIILDISALTDFDTVLNTKPTVGPTLNSLSSADAGWVKMANNNAIATMGNTNFTVEMWFKTSVSSATDLMSIGQNTSGNYFLLRLNKGDITIQGYNSATENASSSQALLNDNNWHHVAVARSGGTFSLYIDGQATTMYGNTTFSTNFNGGDLQVAPGTGDVGVNSLRVWDVARTTNEIQSNRHGTIAANSAGLKGYWTFDNVSGSTVYDETSNGINGTLMGGATTTAISGTRTAAIIRTTNTDFAGVSNSYVVTSSDLNILDSEQSANQVTYTVKTTSSLGNLQKYNGSTWVTLNANDTFTQQDVNSSNIRFAAASNITGYPKDNVVCDVSDGAGGTVNNVAIRTEAYEITNNSLAFDSGANKIVDNGSSALISAIGTGNFAVETWVRTTNSARREIFFMGTAATNQGFIVAINSGKLLIMTHSTTLITGTKVFNDDSWHHIAVVRNGGTIYAYVDGVADGSAATTLNVVGGQSYIGSSPGRNAFVGEFAEFRVWNTNLSLAQINANRYTRIPYNTANLIAQYDFEPTDFSGTLYDNARNFTGTITGTTGTLASTFDLNYNSGSRAALLTSSSVNLFTTQTPSSVVYTISSYTNTNVYIQKYNGTVWTNMVATNTFTQADINSGIIRFLDGGSTTNKGQILLSVTDGTTTANVKFLPAFTINLMDAGPQGNIANLDGVGYISGSSNSGVATLGTSNFTIETWFKTTTNGSNIFGVGQSGTTNRDLFLIISNNTLLCNSPLVSMMSGSTIVTDGVWHHVAVVRSGNNFYIYLDGNLEATATNASMNIGTGSGDRAYFGAGYGSGRFTGSMAQIRVWNTALTQTQISQGRYTQYNPGTTNLISELTFNSANSSVIDDDSGNNNYASFIGGGSPTITTNSGGISSAGVVTQAGTNVTFSTSLLNVTDPVVATSGITYTIKTLPTNGNVQFFNGAWGNMTVGQSFTQQDVANGKVRFTPGALTASVVDKVILTLSDSTGETINDVALRIEVIKDPTQAGPKSAGITLDGSTDIAVNSAFNSSYAFGTGNYSAEAWVKLSDSGRRDILAIGDTGTAGASVIMYVNNGLLCIDISSTTLILGKTKINDNNFHHVAFVHQGSSILLYVDGVIENVAATSVNITGAAATYLIGKSINNSNRFLGQIDQVRVWNKALSTTEVAQNQYITMQPGTANLVSAVDFSSYAGNTVYDTSGNKSYFTINGNYNNSISTLSGGVNLEGAQVSSNNAVIINQSYLNITDTGAQPASNVVYKLTSLASNGTLQKLVGGNWTTLTTNSTFTQDDVNNNNIRFLGSSASTTSDKLLFTVTDSTGNQITNVGLAVKVFNNAPQGGLIDSVGNFSGSQYIDLGTQAAVKNTANGDFTIEMWINTTSYNHQGLFVLSNSANQNMWYFYTNNGNLSLALTSPSNQILASNTLINDGQWHHVSLVHSGTSAYIYIDGQLNASVTVPANVLSNVVTNSSIGGGIGSYPGFVGQMGEVQLWNTALTQTQISDNMYRQYSSNTANLVGRWNLDNTNGTTVNDSNGNSITGTIVGSLPITSKTTGVNFGNVHLDENSNLVLSSSIFNVTDTEQSDNLIIYTLNGTSNGKIQKQISANNWQDVSNNSTFSLADIKNGNIRFVPTAEYYGEAYIQLSASDSQGHSTSNVRLFMTVDFVPASPVLVADNTINLPHQSSVGESIFYVVDQSILNYTNVDRAPTGMIYTIQGVAADGKLQLFDGVQWNTMGLNSTFTQDQINNNRVRFHVVHPALQASLNFTLSLSDGYGHTVNNISLDINASQLTLDAPQVVTNNVLVMPHQSAGQNGTDISTSIDSTVLSSTSDDQIVTKMTYTVKTLPTYGSIQKDSGGGFAALGIGDTFTQADINNGKIQFTVHHPSTVANLSVGLQLDDGYGQTKNLTLSIDDSALLLDAPQVATNNTIIMPHQSTVGENVFVTLSNTMLKSTSDDQGTSGLTYKITSTAAYGTIQFNNGGGFANIGLNDTFTQADIDNGKVRFTVQHPSTITSLSVGLQLSDGYGQTKNLTLNIDDSALLLDAPQIATNNTVVMPGASLVGDNVYKVISNTLLKTTSDDQISSGLVYKITGSPAYGSVQFDNGGGFANLGLNGTFTQADIDNGKVRFTVEYPSSISSLNVGLQLQDGYGQSKNLTLHIDASALLLDPPEMINNTTLTMPHQGVGQNGTDVSKIIDHNIIEYSSNGQVPSGLIYTITNLPAYGSIQKDSGGGFVALGQGGTFTQEDINNGKVRFTVHHPSTVASLNVGLQLDDGTGKLINLALSVDDSALLLDAPQITTNNTIVIPRQNTVGENVTFTIDNNTLKSTSDDQNASGLSYKITGAPAYGSVQLDSGGGFVNLGVNDTFTQADIDSGKVRFVVKHPSTISNLSVGLQLNDGYGQTQNLTVNIDDSNIILNAPQIVNNNIVIMPHQSTPGEDVSLKIDNTYLKATSDDQIASGLVYKITGAAAYGAIQFDTGSGWTTLGLNDTFTQDDIDNGKIHFTVHHPSPTANLTVGLQLNDGYGQTQNITLKINDASLLLDAPQLEKNVTIKMPHQAPGQEGTNISLVIDNTALKFSSDDQVASGLTYTVSTLPAYGSIERDGGGGFAPLGKGDTFTQADIDSGKVRFTVKHPSTVSNLTVGLVLDDGFGQTKNVTLSVDDSELMLDAPQVVKNNTIKMPHQTTVGENVSLTIDNNLLKTTSDDQVASGLVYKIIGIPAYGAIQLDSGTGFINLGQNDTFTQADIDSGKVRFTVQHPSTIANLNVGLQLNDGYGQTQNITLSVDDSALLLDAPQVVKNNTITMPHQSTPGEEVSFTIDNTFLKAASDDQIAKGLVYKITGTPTYGNIQFDNGGGFANLGLNDTFTQEDIDNGKVRFTVKHPSTIANLTVGLQLSDGYGQTQALTLNVDDSQLLLDAPQINHNSTITLPHQAQVGEVITKPITASSLEITHDDQINSNLVFTVTSPSAQGNLQINLGNNVYKDLGKFDTFTQKDIDDGKIRFSIKHPASTANLDIGLSVNDGYGQTLNLVLDIDGSNLTIDSPQIVNDNIIVIPANPTPGQSMTVPIDTNILKVTHDDQIDSNLKFTVTGDAAKGNLQIKNPNNTYSVLKIGDSFTQQDIDDGRIVFSIQPPSTQKNLSIGLSLDDGYNHISNLTLDINADNIVLRPIVISNNGLVTLPHQSAPQEIINTPITSSTLQITEQNVTPEQLSYKISSLPVQGTLQIDRGQGYVNLTPQDTFTQADINQGKIRFQIQHPASASNLSIGLISFDQNNQTQTLSLNIDASLLTLGPPVLTNNGFLVLSRPLDYGQPIIEKISDSILKVTHDDQTPDKLVFTVSSLSSNVKLQLLQGNVFMDLTPGNTFTQQDVSQGLLNLVLLSPSTQAANSSSLMVNLSLNDGYNQHMNVTLNVDSSAITPLPVETIPVVLTVHDDHTNTIAAVITPDLLPLEIAGSEAINLTYKISDLPAEGELQIYQNGEFLTLSAGEQISHSDINKGLIRYVNNTTKAAGSSLFQLVAKIQGQDVATINLSVNYNIIQVPANNPKEGNLGGLGSILNPPPRGSSLGTVSDSPTSTGPANQNLPPADSDFWFGNRLQDAKDVLDSLKHNKPQAVVATYATVMLSANDMANYLRSGAMGLKAMMLNSSSSHLSSLAAAKTNFLAYYNFGDQGGSSVSLGGRFTDVETYWDAVLDQSSSTSHKLTVAMDFSPDFNSQTEIALLHDSIDIFSNGFNQQGAQIADLFAQIGDQFSIDADFKI